MHVCIRNSVAFPAVRSQADENLLTILRKISLIPKMVALAAADELLDPRMLLKGTQKP